VLEHRVEVDVSGINERGAKQPERVAVGGLQERSDLTAWVKVDERAVLGDPARQSICGTAVAHVVQRPACGENRAVTVTVQRPQRQRASGTRCGRVERHRLEHPVDVYGTQGAV